MRIPKSFFGLRWLFVIVAALVIAALVVGVLHAAQRRIESPQLISISAQPVYDETGKLIGFPVTIRHKITEKLVDGTTPKSWIQTTELDLVVQEKMTMALDGDTVEFSAVRDDLIEVAHALYRSQHPPPLPTMQRKAIRGEPRQ